MQLLRSLHHRNFRLFFAGQIISVFGVWMQGTAVSWLTWRLTHSTTWLGLVGFASQVPILVFGLVAGVVVDRISRWRLIVSIQIAAAIQAGLLAGLAISGHITVLHVFFLTLLLGFVFALDFPTRQTFLMDMVGREDIGNAIALNASMVHFTRTIGPAVAGLVVARWGEGTCFLINALSFVPVIVGFFLMDKDQLFPQEYDGDHSILSQIREGLRLAWTTPEIRCGLTMVGILSLTFMPVMVLLPKLVAVRFAGGVKDLGILMGAVGLGALIGSGVLAVWKGNLLKLARASLILIGISMVFLSIAGRFSVAIPILVVIGLASLLIIAGMHTLLQQMALPSSRGRIMSIFTVTYFGLAPIASIAAGVAASYIGEAWTIALSGVICFTAPYFLGKEVVGGRC